MLPRVQYPASSVWCRSVVSGVKVSSVERLVPRVECPSSSVKRQVSSVECRDPMEEEEEEVGASKGAR